MSTQTLFSTTASAASLSRTIRAAKCTSCKDTPAAAAEASSRGADTVELSAGATVNASTNTAASSPTRNSGIRSELVSRIKLQIDSGTYDVDAKLDKVADGILRDLNLQG